MTSIVKHVFEKFGKPLIGTGLVILLVACESAPLTPLPPLTETRPATGTPAIWNKQLVTGKFTCELDDRVEIKMSDGQNNIALTWDGQTHVMLPVTTSTGALRFEDSNSGLVWIQIPAKSMLLNSKLGQQLANECKV